MAILHVLEPHLKDLGGGFMVRRLLPSALRQAVGPFVFFDHFGPVTNQPTDNHDVRPHPHIGLSTVTYRSKARWFTETAPSSCNASSRARSTG